MQVCWPTGGVSCVADVANEISARKYKPLDDTFPDTIEVVIDKALTSRIGGIDSVALTRAIIYTSDNSSSRANDRRALGSHNVFPFVGAAAYTQFTKIIEIVDRAEEDRHRDVCFDYTAKRGDFLLQLLRLATPTSVSRTIRVARTRSLRCCKERRER